MPDYRYIATASRFGHPAPVNVEQAGPSAGGTLVWLCRIRSPPRQAGPAAVLIMCQGIAHISTSQP
jgi:hypothetical protein